MARQLRPAQLVGWAEAASAAVGAGAAAPLAAASRRPTAASAHLHTGRHAALARDAPRTPVVDTDEVLGVMTPVTRRLWLARLARQAAAAAAGQTHQPVALRSGPLPAEPVTIHYPLATDPAMRALYRNPWGAVRLGRVLEDLDSLAGAISVQHCAAPDAARVPLLVTASVDAIHFRRPLPADKDMTAVGAVVWTGKSSMDIRIEMHDDAGGGGGETSSSSSSSTSSSAGVAGSLLGSRPPALAATFTFACRDPDTAAPLTIPALEPPTYPAAVAWWDERASVAAARRAARAAAAASPASAAAPRPSPAADALLAQARTVSALPSLAPPGVLLSSATSLTNSFICQPQQRNLAGRIFGGLIMRRAFELAYATAYTFAGWRPTLSAVEEVAFLSPVDVGDLLTLKATVLHTSTSPAGRRGHVHVVVSAHVVRPEARTAALSNEFHFRYDVELRPGGGEGDGPPAALRSVLPSSPEEARMVVEHHGK
jgi:acyl-coenzyme A thioesterase 9